MNYSRHSLKGLAGVVHPPLRTHRARGIVFARLAPTRTLQGSGSAHDGMRSPAPRPRPTLGCNHYASAADRKSEAHPQKRAAPGRPSRPSLPVLRALSAVELVVAVAQLLTVDAILHAPERSPLLRDRLLALHAERPRRLPPAGRRLRPQPGHPRLSIRLDRGQRRVHRIRVALVLHHRLAHLTTPSTPGDCASPRPRRAGGSTGPPRPAPSPAPTSRSPTAAALHASSCDSSTTVR